MERLQQRGYQYSLRGPCANGDYQHVDYVKGSVKRTIHFGPKSAKP
jgi:hypothetical protein